MKTFFKIVLGSCLGVFLALVLAIGVISLIGVSAASTFTSGEKMSTNSILRLDFSTMMPEKTNNITTNTFSFDNKTYVGVADAIRLIKNAKTDDNIAGVYLNPDAAMSMGAATIKDMHDAILDFKTSGKFVYAYGEGLSQNGYYLSSTADKIYLNPMGDVSFKGLGIGMMYFKNLLDKLNIKMDIFYVGKFKSATEPFRQDKMSAENRTQLKQFLNGMFDQTVNDIAQNRGINPDELKQLAAGLTIQTPEDALKYRFIDEIAYENDVFQQIKSKLKLKEKDKLKFVSMGNYYDAVTLEKNYKASDKLALIFAEGEINDTDSKAGEIGGKAYVQLLRKARYDDKVKAVVLRINSPGGSAYASEQMWHEVSLLKAAGKKVVVSMGDYAASGGYYIACNADTIFASPNTITGSIGVFGILGNFGGFMNQHLNITLDSVKTGPNALGINSLFELNPTEKQWVQHSVERVYDLFTDRVAKGRNLSKAVVDSLAQGRIYSGTDALALGLVDRIGTLEDAIMSAASLAGISDYRIVEFPESKPPLEQMLEQFTGQSDDNRIARSAVENELKGLFPEYMQAKAILSNNKIQARLPFIAYPY